MSLLNLLDLKLNLCYLLYHLSRLCLLFLELRFEVDQFHLHHLFLNRRSLRLRRRHRQLLIGRHCRRRLRRHRILHFRLLLYRLVY